MKTFVKRATSSLMVLIMSAGLTVTANAASISETVQEPAVVETVTASGTHQEVNSVAQATLEWGNGFAAMINDADMERYAYVKMKVYKSKSGELITDNLHAEKKIKYGKQVKLTTVYLAPDYNYQITAGIHNGPNASYTLGWSTVKRYS